MSKSISGPSAKSIASADLVSGEVVIKHSETFQENPLTQGDLIYSFDRISTGVGASVIVTTNQGDQVRLGENTIVTLEESGRNESYLLTLLAGSQQTLKNNGHILVNNIKEKWKSLYFSTTSIKKAPVVPVPSSAKIGNDAVVVSKDVVDGRGIKENLDGQKGFLNRCYAKFLATNPDGKGKVVVGFILEPSGKSSQIKILTSSFNENDIESCVVSVIERTPFKKFNGDSIYVTYPVDFE
ncbi:MAG: AgmX/PglI C-terminal domain-containing protein [Pseudomonadota bacterium]|nr:AgmX/PglI C-terminal domain-containing protein [Pseudomonadota bacterium]